MKKYFNMADWLGYCSIAAAYGLYKHGLHFYALLTAWGLLLGAGIVVILFTWFFRHYESS